MVGHVCADAVPQPAIEHRQGSRWLLGLYDLALRLMDRSVSRDDSRARPRSRIVGLGNDVLVPSAVRVPGWLVRRQIASTAAASRKWSLSTRSSSLEARTNAGCFGVGKSSVPASAPTQSRLPPGYHVSGEKGHSGIGSGHPQPSTVQALLGLSHTTAQSTLEFGGQPMLDLPQDDLALGNADLGAGGVHRS